ncbi:nucleotidyltransferase substrate binding protein [Flavobacteriaceae bacterium XHP0103]|uniref:nucleotidyltransferase substrate binding protein n=1 Tax=Marixanthotalea marina TaxID=2844359 RepID=UPI002989BF48|nr:nucleotidyltransferase substrate binding protein [Marixanthotalea marina]MBU3822507.1 nucleotidyltransferase substrate binding protein [Marixanthotalea marina]
MSKQQDIRWEQRFSNYVKAFDKLDQAVTKIKNDYQVDEDGNIDDDEFLDDIIKEGLIQRFEYTHELAWKVMKDFLEDVGDVKMYGSKDATREAFAADLITNGDTWMDMILSRNKTSHTYNEETADEIFTKIINNYQPAFQAFLKVMEEKRSGKQGNLLEEK